MEQRFATVSKFRLNILVMTIWQILRDCSRKCEICGVEESSGWRRSIGLWLDVGKLRETGEGEGIVSDILISRLSGPSGVLIVSFLHRSCATSAG
jgi:hypothetical protein